MKHITTTLMLIAGFQFSICGETLVFEKVFQENEIPIPTNETKDRESLEDFQKNQKVDLGTIRLEIGETLTLGEIKHLREQSTGVEGSYRKDLDFFPFVELELNYDFFAKAQKLTIANKSDKTWKETFTDDIISADNVNWPIEGPVTISLKAKPYFERLFREPSVRNYFYKLHQLANQYLRITFKKEVASINNNQNKLQVLVLPKGSKNMNVIMESSEDLVNWTTDSLGLKTTTDGHRFFRLRAVKE